MAETATSVEEKKTTGSLPEGTYTYAFGRRKESTARVRLYDGSGRVFVNGLPIEAYFTRADHRTDIRRPFEALENKDQYDVSVRVTGGGISGQAGAVRLGIARAMLLLQPELRTVLKRDGLLRRDPRMKERKKFGLRSARRAPQWSKR
ncbi:MAG: 30S ribosomal protein S9 [Candidatus Doudnabacteria bacterium]|nr:30S ribosomal protein S9 [Candidatus Doudnabacteria bacterium]